MDVSLEPLDEYLVMQPVSDETETRAGPDPPRLGGRRRRVPHGHRDGDRRGRDRHRAG